MNNRVFIRNTTYQSYFKPTIKNITHGSNDKQN